MDECIIHGSLPMLKIFLEYIPCTNQDYANIIFYAAKHNCMDVFHYILDMNLDMVYRSEIGLNQFRKLRCDCLLCYTLAKYDIEKSLILINKNHPIHLTPGSGIDYLLQNDIWRMFAEILPFLDTDLITLDTLITMSQGECRDKLKSLKFAQQVKSMNLGGKLTINCRSEFKKVKIDFMQNPFAEHKSYDSPVIADYQYKQRNPEAELIEWITHKLTLDFFVSYSKVLILPFGL